MTVKTPPLLEIKLNLDNKSLIDIKTAHPFHIEISLSARTLREQRK